MVNKVTLIGKVGTEPILSEFDNGRRCSSKIRLVTIETYRTKTGERKEDVQWHNITFFDKIARTMQEMLTKGCLVYLEGKIKNTKYKSNEGDTKFFSEIIANKITIITKGRDVSKDVKATDENLSGEEIQTFEDES